MPRAIRYLTLDTETATLPFANELARNAKEKQDIAIARPLVYDIGWIVHNSKGDVFIRRSFLVTETFSVPSIFNTAYYREKRPLYLEMLRKGEIELKRWEEITELLFADLSQVDYCCAANAAFDYRKAIPFTEQYIYHLYNSDYQEWENIQRKVCVDIINKVKYNKQKTETNNTTFCFKGIEFPIIDTWGVACEHLINTQTFKKRCLANGNLSDSGKFFETSVESVYQFLHDDYSFVEDHTAVSDASIEMQILIEALKRGKVVKGIVAFPFRILGTTDEFLCSDVRGLRVEHFDVVIRMMEEKYATYPEEATHSFKSQLGKSIGRLKIERARRFGD